MRTFADHGRVSNDMYGPDYSGVQRNLALELVRVTEAAALAGGRWLGKGDKNAADQVRCSPAEPHSRRFSTKGF